MSLAYKDTEITLNDSLFIKDQNLAIKRYPFNQSRLITKK